MLAADMESSSIELIAQHTGTHERVFQMQSVNLQHERLIRDADRIGLIVDAAPFYVLRYAIPPWRASFLKKNPPVSIN
jgi:hypothetical protein